MTEPTPDLPLGNVQAPTPKSTANEHVYLLNKENPAAQLKPPVEEPLPKRAKFLFGVGEIGLYSLHLLIGFFLQTFFLEVAGLSAFETGTVLLLGQLWSAVMNPLVGQLSDHTNSMWGRRRPWILFAALPFGVCYFLLWQTYFVEKAWRFEYYTICFILFNTAQACTSVPYTSLTPELTSRYDERTVLTTLRFFYALIAGIVASFGHAKIIEGFANRDDPRRPDYREGYTVSGVLFGLLSVIPSIVVFWAVRERPNSTQGVTPPQLRGVRGYFYGIWLMVKNVSFLLVMAVYILSSVSINCVQSNLFLYVKYVLGHEKVFSYMLLMLQVVIAVSLLGWQQISKRIGKKEAYYIGMAFWIAVEVSVYFVPAKDLVIAMSMLALAGVGVGAAILIPWSMLPDVIELDELQTGLRREGLYYSIFVVLQQMGIAGALSFSSYLLGVSGYVAPTDQKDGNDTQPEAVLRSLRLLVGPIPALLLMISLVFAFFYPITKQRHEEILKQLEERKYLPIEERLAI